MKLIDIYQYNNPKLALIDALNNKKELDKSFSARKWAKEMGLNGHSLLAMILQGKRSIKVKHADFFSKWFEFNSNEERYFKTLIQFYNSKTVEEKKFVFEVLSELNPNNNFDAIEVNQYEVIANWIHMAIMAMTQLKDFKGTEEEVFSLLGGKATLYEIRAAITRLLNLTLLAWTEDGKLKATHNYVSTSNDIKNKAAREYHKQVMDLAKEALEEVPLDRREFQSFVMAVDNDKVDMAKQMIRDFRVKLHKAVSGNGDNIYQTNVQFFQLTENSGENQEIKALNKKILKEKN
jgi:uncharacterized protein (TIGR02147 family)